MAQPSSIDDRIASLHAERQRLEILAASPDFSWFLEIVKKEESRVVRDMREGLDHDKYLVAVGEARALARVRGMVTKYSGQVVSELSALGAAS